MDELNQRAWDIIDRLTNFPIPWLRPEHANDECVFCGGFGADAINATDEIDGHLSIEHAGREYEPCIWRLAKELQRDREQAMLCRKHS